MCFLSKGTYGGTFLRSWLRLSFPSCRKASYLLGKHHGLDANQPKSIIIGSKPQYLLVSCHYVFFGSLISQQLPVPRPTASFGRGGLGAQDDAQDGMILHVGHAGHAADLAVQEASGLRFYLWSLWTLVQAGGFRSNLDTMAKSKRIERLTAWFLGQAWSQAVASESQQLLAGSNVLNCQTYQKNACFPTGYWINSSILSIRTHVGYYHYWRIPNLP